MTFSVVFTGDINPNSDKADVVEKLMGLFKKDQAFVEKLLSGKKVIIKRQLEHEIAKKYQAAIMKAGAFTCLIDESATDPVDANDSVSHSHPSHADKTEVEMSVAKPGEIIIPSEKISEPHIDISGLDLAQVGETIVEPEPRPEYHSKGTLFELSDTGEALVENRKIEPVNIDTDHLSVSRPGVEILKTD